MWSSTSAGGHITCLPQGRERGTGAACTELDSGSEPIDSLHESLRWAGETDHGILWAAGNGVRDWHSRQALPVPIVVKILGLIQPRKPRMLESWGGSCPPPGSPTCPFCLPDGDRASALPLPTFHRSFSTSFSLCSPSVYLGRGCPVAYTMERWIKRFPSPPAPQGGGSVLAALGCWGAGSHLHTGTV